MPVDDLSELGAALGAGDFARVTGTAESQWVDFKAHGYATAPESEQQLTKYGRWELCKDVAAFANGGGGSIVIGYPEERDESRAVAVAATPQPVSKVSINRDAYSKTVVEGRWLYPAPRGVRFTWYDDASDASRGIFEIHVPPQKDQLRPFVMRRLVDAEDREFDAIGVPEREGDRTFWLPPEQVQQEMNAGRLARIFPHVSAPTPEPPRLERGQDADERIHAIEDSRGWGELPALILQAVPSAGPSRLPQFFDPGGPVDALQQPASLRASGFNFVTLGPIEFVDGNAVARSFPETAAVLEPDGFFTAGWLAHREMLGWAVTPPNAEYVRLNPIAVVELTYEFFRYVTSSLMPRADVDWSFRIACLRFAGGGVVLEPGRGRRVMPSLDAAASGDDWRRWLPDVGDRDPARLAFEALAELYALFGHGDGAIPFSKSDSRIVDEHELLQV